MRIALVSVAVAALSACAGMTPVANIEARKAAAEANLPWCDGEADCKAKWQAAQIFVATHSGMKIQTATDVLIETYNPVNQEPSLAMRVMRQPLGGGRYGFGFWARCGNMFGCTPGPLDAWEAFNRDVAAARP